MIQTEPGQELEHAVASVLFPVPVPVPVPVLVLVLVLVLVPSTLQSNAQHFFRASFPPGNDPTLHVSIQRLS